MDKQIISLKKVWVRYKNHIVLENINLSIKKGEIISIVGPNGGGKTTLLKTILGLKKPYQGEIQVFEKKATEMSNTGLIGYLPQSGNFERQFPVTAYDVVALSVYAKKSVGRKVTREEKDRIIETLVKVEMDHLKNHHFGSLSGGQQQRVLIARALAGNPKLLILDEPSTSLDTVAQDSFYHLLERIRNEENMTILMVSHDIGSVYSLVDQIACLNRQIHYHGKPNDGIPVEALDQVYGKDIHFLLHDDKCKTCEKTA